MKTPAAALPARPVLVVGALYMLLFGAAVTLLPRPGALSARIVCTALWLAPPALLALGAGARKALLAHGAERVLWAFLAAACALHALAVGLLLWQGLDPSERVLARVLGLLAYHGTYVLLVVGLLAASESRRAASAELRKASLEWLLIALGGAFVVSYFILLPAGASPWPWFLLHSAESMLPTVLILRRALLAREPHRSSFGILALGFGFGALIDLRANWLYVMRGYEPYSLIDLAWMVPFWSVAAAARIHTDAPWLVQTPKTSAVGRRTRFATVAVMAPPLIDLGARALRFPGDADARSVLALAASALLALLVGLRLREGVREGGRPPAVPQRDDGSPELRRLASGTAHELNNPLMAVVVAAELALARGGAEAPLRALQQAVHDAAAAVRRFQLVAAGRDADPEAPR